jgi:AraC-like DNA-binding protein
MDNGAAGLAMPVRPRRDNTGAMDVVSTDKVPAEEPYFAARPVKAIAARWGFTSAAHFSQAFRRAYGFSPGEFRRQCATVHAD